MKLKSFLLIGFVLNVTCLNNLSGKFPHRIYDSFSKDPSSLVELFGDELSLRKNESLVESLNKDPSSFVELFAKADPQKINQIIVLLQGLLSEATSTLTALEDHQTETSNNLATADANLVEAISIENTAKKALDDATTAKENADDAKVDAGALQEIAQVEKNDADTNYAEQSPGLISEHRVLQEVIEILRSLTGTSKYSIEQGKCRQSINFNQYGGMCYCGSTLTPEDCYTKSVGWSSLAAVEYSLSDKNCFLYHFDSSSPTNCPYNCVSYSGSGGDVTKYNGDGDFDRVCMLPL